MVQCHSSSESAQNPYPSEVCDNEDAARKFKAIQTWWQDMADRNSIMQPDVSILQTSRTTESNTAVRGENAARTIQSHIRGLVVRRKFLKMVNAVTLLQTVFRAWLKARQKSVCMTFPTGPIYDFACEISKQSKLYERYAMLFYHRHSFLRLKRSVQLIQQAVRSWLYRKPQQGFSISPDLMISDMAAAATTVQKFVRGWMARSRYIHQLDQKEKALNLAEQKLIFDLRTKAAVSIQLAWENYIWCKSTRKEHIFATKIQCNFRRWLLRKRFLNQIRAVIKIQSCFRMRRCIQNFKSVLKAAIVIQSCFCGWITRKDACARRNQIVEIQRHCRGWLVKRNFLLQRDAIVKIQSVSRSLKCQKTLNCQKDAALEIQRFIRGHLTRNRLLGSAFKLHAAVTDNCISRPVGIRCFQLEAFMSAVVKLQRWWKGLLLLKLMVRSAIKIQSCTRGWIARRKAKDEKHHITVLEEYAALELQRYIRGHLTRNLILGSASKLRAVAAGCISKPTGYCSFQLELFLFQVVILQRWWKYHLLHKLMTKSAIIIQSHIRGLVARRKTIVYRHHIIVIQSHWKGYVARKQSTKQLMDLRLRLQESSKNVDDSKRLINRLLAALSELLNMKSLSDILHTCSTLDLATGHSQRCCEELVAAGAIDTLLRLIRSISRSIPDQQVLKHVLSTLRNLARYPHLLEVLIKRNGSIQTIVLELLRNKEEGFFIASDLLKKICSTHEGVDAILKSHALQKRLHSLAEELTRKVTYQKRNVRGPTPSPVAIVRGNTDRRLKEASEILSLLTHR